MCRKSVCRTCSTIFLPLLTNDIKAWPNARNISTQHLATLLHDVATCVERGGQNACNVPSFSTEHVNVHVPQAPGAQEVDLTRMPWCNDVA